MVVQVKFEYRGRRADGGVSKDLQPKAVGPILVLPGTGKRTRVHPVPTWECYCVGGASYAALSHLRAYPAVGTYLGDHCTSTEIHIGETGNPPVYTPDMIKMERSTFLAVIEICIFNKIELQLPSLQSELG